MNVFTYGLYLSLTAQGESNFEVQNMYITTFLNMKVLGLTLLVKVLALTLVVVGRILCLLVAVRSIFFSKRDFSVLLL